MNNPLNSGPARRLSLDLPEFTHENMDEIAEVFGFSSKQETARNALQDFYARMQLVLEGNRPMVMNMATGQITPMYGTNLDHLFQRVQKLKQTEAAAKPKT